jgi:PTS system mannose-specific IIB component
VIVLTRIDNRLLHGQVLEAWVPFLRATRVVIADDAVAHDALAQAALALAVPPGLGLQVSAMGETDFAALARHPERTLVLVRDVKDAVEAVRLGLPYGMLNLGNVHADRERKAVSRSVYLSDLEQQQLKTLVASGMQVQVQAVPAEKPLALA